MGPVAAASLTRAVLVGQPDEAGRALAHGPGRSPVGEAPHPGAVRAEDEEARRALGDDLEQRRYRVQRLHAQALDAHTEPLCSQRRCEQGLGEIGWIAFLVVAEDE